MMPHPPVPMATRPTAYAMLICPDCLRTKPHWVAWHDGACRVCCQECGRAWSMQDGEMVHEVDASATQ